MRNLILALLLLLLPVPASAQSRLLQIDLAANRVDISTGFNGTRIVMFGVSGDEAADIAVTLKGPEHTMAMRRKGRVMGAWINTKSVEFRRVPSYYDYATTLESAVLESNLQFLNDNEIGIEHLGYYSEDADEDPEIVATFRDALIGSMQKKGFYPLSTHAPQIIDRGFFKVTFDLPPGVPTGLYTVEAMLIKNDAVIAKQAKNLRVGQVGFNARIYLFAQNYSFFYGVFAVVMALCIGASAFTFLRRD